MVEDKDIAPLSEVVKYIENNKWQFQMLAPNSSVRMNARILYSVFHYLKAVEKVLSEQQTEGRERPELPPPA